MLHGNFRDNWRRWVQLFDLYLKASAKINVNEDVQCAILFHVIGEEAMEIYNTFLFATEEDRIEFDVLKSKFEEYVNPRKTPCSKDTDSGSTSNNRVKPSTNL